jgi:hypothetical protein
MPAYGYSYLLDSTKKPVLHLPHIRSNQAIVTPPVREPYDVIVGLIQSNVRGVATDFDATDQYNDPQIFQYNWAGQQITPAQETLSTQEFTTGMGALNTFVKDYRAEKLQSGRRILVVNTARGGTGFSTPSTNSNPGVPTETGLHWRHDLPADANNLAIIARDKVKQLMNDLPTGSRIVAFVANHGSTDGSNNTPKATFKQWLIDWINWIRPELNAPTVPYVMMQMRPDLAARETRHRIIDEAQTEVAAQLSRVGKATSPNGADYFRNDVVHFNALGMRIIGHNLFDVWDTFPQL